MLHFFMIPLIMWFSYCAYRALFTDDYKKHYEIGFFPFMPKNLPAYAIAYKAQMLLFLFYSILAYVLIIIGISENNMFYFFIFGSILLFLIHRICIAWLTDDYMELYEKEIFDPIIPRNHYAYAVAQRVINLSLFLIVMVIYILVMTGVIFGE